MVQKFCCGLAPKSGGPPQRPAAAMWASRLKSSGHKRRAARGGFHRGLMPRAIFFRPCGTLSGRHPDQNHRDAKSAEAATRPRGPSAWLGTSPSFHSGQAGASRLGISQVIGAVPDRLKACPTNAHRGALEANRVSEWQRDKVAELRNIRVAEGRSRSAFRRAPILQTSG